MTDRGLLTAGVVGTAIAALCCFTPVLVILPGAPGLTAWLAWLELVLLPVLGVFICTTVYAVVRLVRRRACTANSQNT